MTEDGIYLVILPLLSLIEDQMNQMNEIGVPCIFARKSTQLKSLFKEMNTGKIKTKLLFIKPEKIRQS
jgi:superfamily II DNA helicase RecQ